MVLRAVQSVLAQVPRPAQVIVVDDGSVQPQLPELLALAADGAITLIQEANRGVNGACNRGARELATELMLVLGDDDVLLPGALAALSGTLHHHPHAVGAAGGGRRYFTRGTGSLGALEQPFLERGDYEELIGGNPFFAGAVLFRREAFLAIGGYEEREQVVEDWDLWLRLSRVGPFVTCPAEVIHYTVHPGNVSATSKVAASTTRLVECHLRRLSDDERTRYLPKVGAYLTRLYWADTLWHARVAMRRGHVRGAFGDLRVVGRITAIAVRSDAGRSALRSAWRAHRSPQPTRS
jgi:GT2 family glycosyltransferase